MNLKLTFVTSLCFNGKTFYFNDVRIGNGIHNNNN